jgi:hypothetical protein
MVRTFSLPDAAIAACRIMIARAIRPFAWRAHSDQLSNAKTTSLAAGQRRVSARLSFLNVGADLFQA